MLYGRDEELAEIGAAIESARRRRGRAVFAIGEAGIGKSALLATLRDRTDIAVLEGGAWESPGAPPYWPWIQVVRAAEARWGPRVRDLAGAAQILGGEPAAGADLEPGAARFALLDAAARALVTLADDHPLAVVLDDLHAADLPSLELLVAVCREAPRSAIAVIGAWREHELARRPEAARLLARACRGATVHTLRSLTADEVTRWIGADGAALHAVSEGNPLFVEELVRARRTGVPRGIVAVLEDHLALVSPTTREVLAATSVLGREADPGLLAGVVDRSLDEVTAALHEADAAGLGGWHDGARASRTWRFRHVLLRDHLYDALAPSHRIALHRRAGEALERAGRAPAIAAHHLLAGCGGGDPSHAVAVARAAAQQAMAVFAFEDAAALLAGALRALEDAGATDTTALRLELARTRFAAGDTEAGRVEAMRAAETARVCGDAEELARAALVYGAELTSGRRDPVMVELLEEALGALPSGDHPLRARVAARLGAALVPAPAHEPRPYRLADEAVAMAERLGEDDTLLFTRRLAMHAHGFLRGIVESVPINREVIALSDRLGRPLETLENRTWAVNAALCLGDLAGADAATEPIAALLARVPQPHYAWRLPILRATRATLRGDFEEAERLIAIARRLARDHDLDRARMCSTWAGLCLALVARSAPRAREVVDDVCAMARQVSVMAPTLRAVVFATAGQLAEARAELAAIQFVPPIGLSQFAAEAALAAGDHRVAALCVAPLAQAAASAPLAYGPSMSVVLAPLPTIIAELHLLLGQPAEAIAPAERGHELAQRLAAPPLLGRAAATLAAALAARDRPEDRRRVAELVTAATWAPVDARAGDAEAADVAHALEVVRRGDRVHVRWRGRELALPASKGLDYLAALAARPDSELHVSELVGDDDRGDAGEILDAKARAAYRARAEELEAELATARANHDLGRIDRLAAELEVLTDQLVAATGLGGRSRRAGSRVERARVNVQRRIRDAIRRLAAEDAGLGRYLEATIRTGTFCTYAPIPE